MLNFSTLLEVAKANPIATAAIVVPGVVFLAPGAAAGAVLAPLGFGSGGVVAGELSCVHVKPLGTELMGLVGSWAAAIQGPAVASGSWFATAQSAATGGQVDAVVGKVGGLVAAGAAALAAGGN